MPADHRLNPTAASLLGLLEDCEELTGAELGRVAQVRLGDFWASTRSQVYRELVALADLGYVESGALGPRDARPYRLTDTGRTAFREWLVGAQPAETIRIGLLLVVAFGRHLPPGRLRALLDEHEARHAERLAHYRELDDHLEHSGADPYTRATLSFGVHYEQAVLEWFASLPADVRAGRVRRRGAATRPRRGSA